MAKTRSQSLWLSRRLTESMFGVPSALGIYVVGLIVANVYLWQQSSDRTILAGAAIALALTVYGLAVLLAFLRSRRRRDSRNDSFFISLYSAGAWLFSLVLSALTIRAVQIGDLATIVMSMVMLAGYLIGLIMRAAVLRFAIPSLLLLLLPMAAASAFQAGGDHIAISIVLLLLCLACVRYAIESCGSICAQHTAEHRLSEMARSDQLTGLANRAGLSAQIERLADDDGCGSSGIFVAAIDLDGFKAVNDTLGHAAGDAILREVAVRLTKVLGQRHFAARLGGDEFIVLFESGMRQAEAEEACAAIIDVLKLRYGVEGSPPVSASIGLASAADASDVEAAIRRADSELYRAKAAGKNRLCTSRSTPAAAYAVSAQSPDMAKLAAA